MKFLTLTWSAAAGALLLALALSGTAQISGLAGAGSGAEFHFVRLAYTTNSLRGGSGRGNSLWMTDYPDAEHHFLDGLSRLTRVDAAPDGRVMSLMDDDLFDYPWLYAVEVGGWYLDYRESARLREYLLRGGFLVVDDFHGTQEWAAFMAVMNRVFPDRTVRDIPEDDESLHVLYDLDQRIQIPGILFLRRGVTYERDGYLPHWRGIYDDHGRLMVAINFNMDLGDAWEHADWPQYPENMTALAYRFGINYVLYAMTH